MTRRPCQFVASSIHCCLLVLALAGPAWAADVCTVTPAITPPTPDSKPQLTADTARLYTDGRARVSGHVRLEKNGQAIEAPSLTYNRRSTQVVAPNGLRYYRPGIYLQASHANVVVDSKTGTLAGVTFALTSNGGHGSAKKVALAGPQHSTLYNANYTTCPGTDTPAWQLSADKIELNRNSGRGVARDAVLKIHGWPVLYTPYINFPIDDKRHTGFLLPTLGHSSRSGFELATPYYLNIAPGRDATITPRLLTARGLQLGAQFRYLNAHSKGRLVGQYLPADRRYDHQDRRLAQWQHTGQLDPHVGIQIDYTHVSDDNYFDDLGSGLASTSQSQLHQRLLIGYAATGIRLSILAQALQNLDRNLLPPANIDSYAQLPQIHLALLSPAAPLRAGLDVSMTRFERDHSIEGRRYDLRPRLLWQTDHGGWYAKSQAVWRYTRYDLDNTLPGVAQTVERTIPSVSAEFGLRFQRMLGNGWLQTLEPQAFYLYTGYENQHDIPVFDSGVAGFNFDRLFAHNRFAGIDRIGDANQLTLALSSRLLDPASGRTVVRMRIGRIFGFRDLRVQLPGRAADGYGQRNSDYVAQLAYAPWANIHTALALQYDAHADALDGSMFRIGYQDDQGRQVELSYRYQQDFRPAPVIGGGLETLEQTGVYLQMPVTTQLHLIARWDYSLQASRSVNALVGLAYHASCCWAVRAAWSRHIRHNTGATGGSDYDSAIMLQFELTGLGRFGDDIESAFRHVIVDNSFGINRLEFQ